MAYKLLWHDMWKLTQLKDLIMFPGINQISGFSIRKGASYGIAAVILSLVCVNGVLTFFGANIAVSNIFSAALFAIGIQSAIFISLVSFPHIGWIGKAASAIVYSICVLLSAGFAYVYIYESTLKEADSEIFDTKFITAVTEYVSELYRAENEYILNLKADADLKKKIVDEELSSGQRSGKGPGSGSVFYKKLDEYQAAEKKYESSLTILRKFEDDRSDIIQKLSIHPLEKQKIFVKSMSISSLSQSGKDFKDLLKIIQENGSKSKGPIHDVVNSIQNINENSGPVILAIIWAVAFDLISLFLGIVRYFLHNKDGSIVERTLDGVVTQWRIFHRFKLEITNAKKDETEKFTKEKSGRLNEEQLDEGQVRNLVLQVLAAGHVSADSDKNAIYPVQQIIKKLTPLNIPTKIGAVGINFSVVSSEEALSSIMALFVIQGVFVEDIENSAYILKSESNALAHQFSIISRLAISKPEIIEKLIDSVASSSGSQRLLAGQST